MFAFCVFFVFKFGVRCCVVVCCLWFVLCCLLFGVFIDWCVLFLDRRSLIVVVICVLFVVCCLLSVV